VYSQLGLIERKLLAADLQNRDGAYFIHVRNKSS
jgi:hypothetical protein